MSEDKFTDLMTKLYISFRLFMRHVRHCSDAIPLLSIGTYVVTSSAVAIIVWHSRTIGQLNFEHVYFTLACSVWSALLLTFMSNFHAKVSLELRGAGDLTDLLTNGPAPDQARKLERSFWYAIAVLGEKDPQDHWTRHMRLLLLRQLKAISDEEGIALKICRIRVTYINVLQVSDLVITRHYAHTEHRTNRGRPIVADARLDRQHDHPELPPPLGLIGLRFAGDHRDILISIMQCQQTLGKR